MNRGGNAVDRFYRALYNNDLQLMQQVPKGDCHNHSGLGMRFSTFNRWAGGSVAPPPRRLNGIEGLNRYIQKETLPHVDHREGFEFLLAATLEAAVADGVTVLESSIDCINLLHYDHQDLFFSHIEEVKRAYAPKVQFRPEVGVARDLPQAYCDTCLISCLENDVFTGLDLYGREDIPVDLNRFKEYYAYARKKKKKTKVHAGEFGDPQTIKEIIEILEPQEIQHGIRCVEDTKVMDLIKDRGIRLNISPMSNIRLGAVGSIGEHPIKTIYEWGIEVTLNTDDLLLFDHSVSQEFFHVYRAGLLDGEALDRIRCNGLG